MPSTSMPRAAISVATSVRTCPARKAASTRSRWFCDLLPWIASDARPALASARTTLSAPRLVRVKTSTRSTDFSRNTSASRPGLPARSTWMTRCAIRSTVVAAGVTATRTGSRSIWLARSAISRGIVAEKNSVWRLLGSLVTILRMSWMKPMSSMRSASSSTKTSTRSSWTARLCMRSRSRPGVATRTSTPFVSARIWRLMGTPQIAPVGLEAIDDLGGKLARGTQHQYPAAARLRPSARGGEVIEDGQREGRGLAGSGLRDADHVPRGEHLRNGLGLDWSGGGILLVDERTGDGFAEAEVEKGGQSGIFRMAKRTGAPNVRFIRHWPFLGAQIGSSRLRWRTAACRGEIRHPAWSGLSMN